MASTNHLPYVLIAFVLLFSSTSSSSSDDQPETFPTSWPETGSDESPSNRSPSPSTNSIDSPPADVSPSPAPTPEEVSDIRTTTAKVESNEAKDDSSSKGMSGGKKAGIAVGVIAAACVFGFGGMLYEKRKQNMERAQLGNGARREIGGTVAFQI